MSFIENDLRERREALKMSRAQVAELAGCTVSAVHAAERGGTPRGGQAIIDKIDTVLRGEKGGVLSTETVIDVGDIVAGTVNDEQLMLRVRRVGPDDASTPWVEGVQLESYDGDVMKDCIGAGADIVKFRGRNHVLWHVRTIRRSAITAHWPHEPQREETLADKVL